MKCLYFPHFQHYLSKWIQTEYFCFKKFCYFVKMAGILNEKPRNIIFFKSLYHAYSKALFFKIIYSKYAMLQQSLSRSPKYSVKWCLTDIIPQNVCDAVVFSIK